ncbi:MAG TPA: MFS transporter [Puia sp.]|nr:MFS transporter [Puia sp.]
MKKTRSTTRLFAGLTANSFLLAFTSLFADISSEMLYPILPVYLTQTLKASGSIVGIIEGIAETTQNLIQGVSGTVSDRLRKYKAIALAGYIVGALSKPLIGLATSWPFVLVFRFTERLGTGIRSAPRDALIAGSTDAQHRGKAFGLEGFGDNLGACIGPLVAVLLIFSLHWNLRNVFYFAFIPGLLAVMMVLSVREKAAGLPAKMTVASRFTSFPGSFKRYLLAVALFGLGNSSNAFLILQTKSLGLSFAGTILVYAGFNLVAALVSYPAGHLSDKLGRKTIFLLALVIFLITYAGFAASGQVWIIAALFGLYGVYQGIYRSIGKAIAADLSPAGLRASGLGWYATTVGVTGLVASVVAGILWDKIGHYAVFLFGAIFALAGIVSFMLLDVRVPGRERQI